MFSERSLLSNPVSIGLVASFFRCWLAAKPPATARLGEWGQGLPVRYFSRMLIRPAFVLGTCQTAGVESSFDAEKAEPYTVLHGTIRQKSRLIYCIYPTTWHILDIKVYEPVIWGWMAPGLPEAGKQQLLTILVVNFIGPLAAQMISPN